MQKKVEENMWRHFFKNPRTNYNPYMKRLADYPDYIMYDKEIINLHKGEWSKKGLNNLNPLYLEIGSGSGSFAVEMAKKYPERNYLALELRFKRLVLSAVKAQKSELKNLLFLRRRAEEIIEFIGNNEIEGVYINFPDPWEGNEKNRVLQPRFFELLDKVMKKGGVLFFKTDHDRYYNDVLEFSKQLENYEIIYHTDDLHNSIKAEDNIKTEFENLFINKHSKNINYIEIKKIK